MSGETVTRGVEMVGLFEDDQRSGMCGAQCTCVYVCVGGGGGLFDDER